MSFLAVSSPVLYLGAIVLFSPIVFAYAIAFVDPSHRLQRGSILLGSTAVAASLQRSVPAFTGNGTYDGVFMSYVWILHLRAFDLLFLKAAYLSAPAVRTAKQVRFLVPQSKLSKLFTAWLLLFNLRNVNTSWSIKGLPVFSSRRPEYVPTKNEFVKRRIAHVLTMYLILDVVFTFLPAPNPANDVPRDKEPLLSRIRDVSLEEGIARPFTVLLPGFSIYGIFTIPYNTLSIIAVVFCGDQPENWPPLFGNILDAFTLRRFWGKSWHQIFRSSLEGSSDFLTAHVLCIPRDYKLVSRCVRLHLAFFITALVHIPGVVILGESPFSVGVPKFFLMQAVGIVIESTVLYMWMTITRAKPESVISGRMTKLLGYIWVLAWTTWTGPSFTWLVARALIPGKDDVVPWSFLKWLGYGNLQI